MNIRITGLGTITSYMIYIYTHIIVFKKKHDIIDAGIHGTNDRIQRYPNDTPKMRFFAPIPAHAHQ